MSSKFVKMLLRSTDPSNYDDVDTVTAHGGTRQKIESTTTKTRAQQQHKPRSNDSKNTAAVATTTEDDLIALHVDKMLMLDNVESNEMIRKSLSSKKRRKSEGPGTAAATTIVTNSRGSAMQAKRVFVPTFNKSRDKREKKDSYFKKMAKKLQMEEKESERKRQKKGTLANAQEK